MLITTRELHGLTLQGPDGKIGHTEALFFEDEHWIVRYLAVNLDARVVLLPAGRLDRVDQALGALVARVRRDEVEELPVIDERTDFERTVEHLFMGEEADRGTPPEIGEGEEQELYSSEHLIGATVRATDDEAGRVTDLVVDDHGWQVRFLVVDSVTPLSGGPVLVRVEDVVFISTASSQVAVRLSRKEVAQSPEFDPTVSYGERRIPEPDAHAR